MYFPTKYLKSPQNPIFGGYFNAKPIIQIAVHQLHVNGATLRLYRYRQVFRGVEIFPLGGVWGAQGPLT